MRLLSLRDARCAAGMALVLGAGGPLLAGCGEAQQDAHEPRALYTLEVLKASFPSQRARCPMWPSP
jgi:hypothetical protein